jgi:adenylate kinase
LILLLFGPPGAGKGTQSALLVSEKGMTHISTGELFRAAMKNQTALGKKAKSYMDAGQLVPDDVTIGLVEEVFEQKTKGDVILDGFPRTVTQANALTEILKSKGFKLDKAVFVQVPNEDLLVRLSGRRVCGKCAATYHVKFQPPKKDGVCDQCGSTDLIQRKDDREDAIQVRLKAYQDSTFPLVEYYKKAGIYTEVDGMGNTEEVYGRLCKAIVILK